MVLVFVHCQLMEVSARAISVTPCTTGRILTDANANCTLQFPSNILANETSSALPSNQNPLPMPPAPFLYRTISSDIALIFVNYGESIHFEDAAASILEGLTQIQELIEDNPPDFARRPILSTLTWPQNRVTLQVLPKIPNMQYHHVLAVMTLLSSFGARYGFIECDFFVRVLVPRATSLQVELGWGRFLTNQAFRQRFPRNLQSQN